MVDLISVAEPSRSILLGFADHCLEIEGRPTDDLEHVGGGRLLLQRFTQLGQQPRVLDGDDGLCGEISHQLNLFLR